MKAQRQSSVNPPPFPTEPCIPLSNLPILLDDQQTNKVLYNFLKKLRKHFYAVILQCLFLCYITNVTLMFKAVHGHHDLIRRLCSYMGALESASAAEQSQISFHSTVLSARSNRLNEALPRCPPSPGLLGNRASMCLPQLNIQELSTADNHSNRRQIPLNKSHAF